ncbi:MAG: hypothetical protein IPM46_01655 [Flavobacteriales bacterium]|nr:hypothetical protein [Flavobacteriales bacterium]
MTLHALPSALATLIASALLMACTAPPAPEQITALNQLITATDGAMLTLNELDRGRYGRADSLLQLHGEGFAQRFEDTLVRDEARALGLQWIALTHAESMGADHERVLGDLIASGERLRVLRNDLATGALNSVEGKVAIALEQKRHTEVINAVHAAMDNYRLLQQAWDRRDTVQVLLANTAMP